MTRATFQLPATDNLPPFTGATQWLNSPPLDPAGLHGKVVLVNFWTYTCVNWLRTLPYIRTWADKYTDQGLVVIGVHTPEFAFEHDIDNVQRAVHDLHITYPVMMDNEYRVWNAFANHYWPALYFADASGRIRHRQFGEGEYEMSERVLQQLLVDAGAGSVSSDLVVVDPQGVETAADWQHVESPETYLGGERTTGFNAPGGLAIGERHTYEPATQLLPNQWTLAGDWTVDEAGVRLNDAHGKIGFRFHARDVNMVMGPATRDSTVPFRVRIDGELPGKAHGSDATTDGTGTLREQRLYQLIRQPEPIMDRLFEIEFLAPGAEALAFTFG